LRQQGSCNQEQRPGGAWVAANMRDLIPDPPEVLLGPMLADAATLDEEVEQRRASQAEPWVDGGV